jgi:MinD-like ATPase involved in chromosome partitioning or flagellar assembly
MMLVVNKTPSVFDLEEVRARAEQAYGCDVAAVLPHSETLMALASAGIFVLRYPEDPVSQSLKKLADRLSN